MTHAWCRDIARDEAVRAAEDKRVRLRLPTLEQAIHEVFFPSQTQEQIEAALDSFAEAGRKAWADVSDHVKWVRELRGDTMDHKNKGNSMATKRDDQAADYRAEASEREAPAPPAAVTIEQIERVTLEFAFDHRSNFRPSEWVASLRPGALCPGLSVRVVNDEGPHEPPTTKEASVENAFATEAPAEPLRDRVTLEIDHYGPESAARWDFAYCLRPRYALESVRVVEEDREAVDRVSREEGYRVLQSEMLTARDERDAAIRERDEQKARVAQPDTELLELRTAMQKVSADAYDVSAARIERDDAIREREKLEGRYAIVDRRERFWFEQSELREAALKKQEARVAELEAEKIGLRRDVMAAEKEAERLSAQLQSVADRAAAAETALEAAPAASGEADPEDADIGYALRLFVDGRRVMSHELDRQQAAAFVIAADRLAKYIRDEYLPTVDEAAPAASEWRDLDPEVNEVVEKGDEIFWHNIWEPVNQAEIGTRVHRHCFRFRRRVPAPAASCYGVIRDMTEILRGDTADADEKHAALSVLVEAVCPGWVMKQAASGGGEPVSASAVMRELIDAAEGVRDFAGQPFVLDQDRYRSEVDKLGVAIAAAEKLLLDPLPATPASAGGEGELAERIAEVLLRKDGLYETVSRLEAMSQDSGRTVVWEEFDDQGENSDGVAQSPVVAVSDAGDLCGDEAGSGEVAGRLTQAASGGGEGEEKVWGVVARQTNEVPPGCASPRRVSRKPVAWFWSQSEAEVFALSRNLNVVRCDAPSQPRVWLREEERSLLLSLADSCDIRARLLESPGTSGSGLPKPEDVRAEAAMVRGIIARSSPPEVLPPVKEEAAPAASGGGEGEPVPAVAASVIESVKPEWVSIGRDGTATLAGTPTYAPTAVEGFPVRAMPDIDPQKDPQDVAFTKQQQDAVLIAMSVLAFIRHEGKQVYGDTLEVLKSIKFDSPPQPRGWLKEEEREAVEYFSRFCDENVVPDQWSVMSARLRKLLARSSPPEVLPPVKEEAAPAASGGGEPVAWGIASPFHPVFGGCKVWTVRQTEEIAKAVYLAADGWQHFPLYAAPLQPEVVRPKVFQANEFSAEGRALMELRDADWLASLAAARVPVKEVG